MNYREKRGAYLNCEKRMFEGVGVFGTPEIQPNEVNLDGAEVIGFNYALGCRHPEDKIVHFFLDDYQFERVWNNPDRYRDMLSKFRAVIAPDFSMYADFPLIVQVFNQYRKQWCGAYWQEAGIKVIPCICWSAPESFEWCFDGVPKHSLVCISTVGGFHSKKSKAGWLEGFNKALDVLEPSEILLFGKAFPEIDFRSIPYITVENNNLKNKATK